MSTLDIPHKITDTDTERICNNLKSFQRYVAFPALDGAHLCAMKPAFVRKDILAPGSFHSISSNAFAHWKQNILHYEQFAGTLLL